MFRNHLQSGAFPGSPCAVSLHYPLSTHLWVEPLLRLVDGMEEVTRGPSFQGSELRRHTAPHDVMGHLQRLREQQTAAARS